jgi:PEGA domain-containing protein
MEVVAKHLMEVPVRPSSLVRGVPAELDAIIVRMLAKDPAQRPSLAELVGLLDRMRNLPPTAFTPIATAQTTQPVRKRAALSPVPFAIAGAIAAAVGMFFLVRSLTSHPKRQVAATEQSQVTATPFAQEAPAAIANPEPQQKPEPVAERSQVPATPAPLPREPVKPIKPTPAPAPRKPRAVETKPRPAAETKPAKGRVKITVDRVAKIMIDRVPVGEADAFEMELSPGPHKLEVEADGFVKFQGKIVVERGETTSKRIKLAPALDPDKQLLEPGAALGSGK